MSSPAWRRALVWRLAAAALALPLAARAADPQTPVKFPPALQQGPADVPPAVPSEPAGPSMDFPDFLMRSVGLYQEPTPEERALEAQKRFHWNFVPFVLTNPLIQFGVGVASAGVFRIGDEDTKLSKFATNFLITIRGQVSVPLRTTIFFSGNEWSLVGYLNWSWFPSPTYGVGGNTPTTNETIVDYGLFRVWQTAYRRLYENLYCGFGAYFDRFYAVSNRGAQGPTNPFTSYPYGTGGPYNNVGASVDLLYESRDNPVNATRGYYASATYRAFPTWLGSTTSWQSLYANARAYFGLPAPNVLALWAYGWFSWGNTPYLNLPSIGTDPDARSGRGYIEGRHIGKDLLYAEAEYRFHIWEFLGGAAGVNVHSASQPESAGQAPNQPRFQYWWPALTAGLRVLVNRPTHANGLVEVGLGLDGSYGIYLNINENF
ncbi:MAG TPA: hypothetical protein VMT17_06780 [Anaeromyxobacteraceae bacterium]|nr:hypothetical protein [Anaeromyxobacteraceae bacterium]